MNKIDVGTQNRKLVNMAENIQFAVQHKHSLAELNPMLNEIQDLVKMHYTEEKALLNKHQDPQIQSRRKDYALILGSIASLKSFVTSSSWPLALEYASTIRNSLMKYEYDKIH